MNLKMSLKLEKERKEEEEEKEAERRREEDDDETAYNTKHCDVMATPNSNTANNRLAQTTNSRLKNDGSEKRIRT